MDSLLNFELRQPATLQQAVAMLAREPGARLLAGGTDLIANLRRGIERPAVLISLGRVAGFDAIVQGDGGLWLGSGVTLARLALDSGVQRLFPAVAQAAQAVAGPSQRNAATLGGNLCLDTRCVFYNQSDWWRAANDHCLKRGGSVCHVAPQGHSCSAAFSGDLAPALLALGAEVELLSARGSRRIALAGLYRDDGAAHLTLEPDELLLRAWLPLPPAGAVSGYRKGRIRGAMDFPLAGVAMALVSKPHGLSALRVALTGTNPQPLLLEGVDALLGRSVDAELAAALGKLVRQQVSPARTTATSSNYRRLLAAALAQRLLLDLAAASGAGALA